MRLVVPGEEVKLTPGAAGVLLRILVKAAVRIKQPQSVKEGQQR
ncbi:hypothetical protein [Nonomuraea antri]|nr:hypothetical protein [Nonomuraea antri]